MNGSAAVVALDGIVDDFLHRLTSLFEFLEVVLEVVRLLHVGSRVHEVAEPLRTRSQVTGHSAQLRMAQNSEDIACMGAEFVFVIMSHGLDLGGTPRALWW